MAVYFALDVRLAGDLDNDRLSLFRERLGLRRQGRLGDTEDEIFGTRTLGEGESAARMTLVRWPDARWQVTLSYRSAPPTAELVADLEAQVRAAAADAGLRVTGVVD